MTRPNVSRNALINGSIAGMALIDSRSASCSIFIIGGAASSSPVKQVISPYTSRRLTSRPRLLRRTRFSQT